MSEFTKTEIESHSAYLTNQRIDKFLTEAGILTASILSSKPNPEITMEFFGVVMSLFTQTHYAYTEKINESIKKEIDICIENSYIINSKLQMTGQYTSEEIFNQNMYCLRALYLMVQGLQNLRYFLRLGRTEAKGIDAALEIFQLDKWKKKEKKHDTGKV